MFDDKVQPTTAITDARAHSSFISTSTPAASLDGTREEFEKWAAAPGGLFDHARGQTDWTVVGGYKSDDEYALHFMRLSREGNGYSFQWLDSAWKSWQASRASDRERVAELEADKVEGRVPTTPYEVHLMEQLLAAESQVSELTELLRKAEGTFTALATMFCKLNAVRPHSTFREAELATNELVAALRSHIEGK